MAENERKYWKGLEERDDSAAFAEQSAQEFAEELPRSAVQWRRRDFLKAAGFTTALVAATGCSRAPVQKAIPLLVQGEENVPGTSLQYATTCAGCSAGCGVLATVRDGRPIKLEGNPEHPLSRGGLCAIGQASILGLYDSHRLQAPLRNGKESTWDEVDAEIKSALEKLRTGRSAVRFLTATVTGPTRASAIEAFVHSFPDAKWVKYDAISRSAILDAHERTHGTRVLPRYRFDDADIIVSFDADFLGTWISPVEFTAGYRQGRRVDASPPRMSWHVQFEPRMSLTGSKADERYAVAPNETGVVLAQIVQRLAAKAGSAYAVPGPCSVPAAFLEKLATRLWNARGHSLIISGANDIREQLLVNYANHLLGNYGATLDIDHPSKQAQGNDRELLALVDEMKQRKVAALFIAGANPAFEVPGFVDALKNVPLVISFAPRRDETALAAHVVCPESNYLETWDDAEPVSGTVAVLQPMIYPLGKARPLVESLATWQGTPQSAYEIIRAHWRAHVFPQQSEQKDFEQFWARSVHDGCVSVDTPGSKLRRFNVASVAPQPATHAIDSLVLVLYPSINMLAGSEAYNAWLQELPDPISKVTWDNCASLSPATAGKLGLTQGDVIRIDSNGQTIELPVYVQPGQHDSVVAVGLGYGSALSERFANIGPHWIQGRPTLNDNGRVGQNAALLLNLSSGLISYTAAAWVERTGKRVELACTQTHHTLSAPPSLVKLSPGQRPIIREATLVQIQRDPRAAVPEEEEQHMDLWPADHPYTGLRWGMVIDLEACTGCSACVIACQAENNIPVVGKDEVRRNREMHWLRVDRYYRERTDGRTDVCYQPMVCQQCENAPCETVCPVLATVHSEDGLNQQIYNRCVGTRYCANNCPYKGRRFNWFNYTRGDSLQNLQLNPDVTVRSRGVMEKCTFCVQRIQAAKAGAKRRGEKLIDGDMQTACQQTCPARAIYFGDLNDANSEVSRMMRNPRRYRVLAELGVQPAVGYMAIVRNRDEESGEHNG